MGLGLLEWGGLSGSQVLTDLVTERDEEERHKWGLLPTLTCMDFYLTALRGGGIGLGLGKCLC